MGNAFVASGTETVPADFTIPEYKDSCVEYVDTIDNTDEAAQTYKTNLEEQLVGVSLHRRVEKPPNAPYT